MTDLIMAGRRVTDVEDALRRYCGLPWSGGEPEVWAYAYFDSLSDECPDEVMPMDVLAAASVHPSLTRSDLAWFAQHRDALQRLLKRMPDMDLADADPTLLDSLPAIVDRDIELSLLSKVLHRKRPRLIPMLDRTLTGWYRQHLSSQGATAWPELVQALGEDLRSNDTALSRLRPVAPLTDLRIADIVIWMKAHS
jgi:hypothetical protein